MTTFTGTRKKGSGTLKMQIEEQIWFMLYHHVQVVLLVWSCNLSVLSSIKFTLIWLDIWYVTPITKHKQWIMGYYFSFRQTATLNLCLIYFKITWALAILLEHMHKKFEINQTKIKGGCQLRSGNPQF